MDRVPAWPQGGSRCREVIGAMSYALDLTEGEPPGHALRSCLIGMRLAEETGLDARGRARISSTRCCSRTPAARPTRPAWPRCSAPTTTRPSAPRSAWTGRGRCPRSRGRCAPSRRAARLARGSTACGDPGRGRGDARADAGPLRARRGDRAHARLLRRRPRRRSARSTSTGTAAASRTACAATEIPLLGADPLPRADGRGLPRAPAALGAACDGRATRRGQLVRPGAGRRAARRPRRRGVLGRRWTTPTSRPWRAARTGSLVVDERPARPHRRGLRRRHRREVAVDLPALGSRLIDRGRASPPAARLPTRTRCATCGRAALLHDIGKLGVSNRILDKPGTADRRRVRARPGASADHRADPRAGPRLRDARAARRRPPRAARRQRLPAGARRARPDDADARCSRWPTSTRR